MGSVLYFGQNILMATLLFWPSHKFVQKWSKLCQGKTLVFGKSSALSQYLLKRNKIKKRKSWLQKVVLRLSFLSCWFILVELHACVLSSKNIFPVYTSSGQRHYRIQISADSIQKCFASLKPCTKETALQTWHRLCAVSTMQREVYAVKT